MKAKDKWEEKLEKMPERGSIKPTKRLAKIMMIKQAGDPKKGIRELMQNAFDAHDNRPGAEEYPIKVRVEKHPDKSVLYFADSGSGWADNPIEFKKKMSLAGARWKDEARGMFGIGRGQVLGMIYDEDQDDFDGKVVVTTMIDGEPWTITNFSIDETISFDSPKKGIRKKNLGDPKHGSEWKIVHPDPEFFDPGEIRQYIKKNVAGEYPVEVNGEKVDTIPEGEKRRIEIEVNGNKYDAIVYYQEGKEGFDIYNRGLKVRRINLVPGWGGAIRTKFNLPVSASREEIDRDTEEWKSLRNKMYHNIAHDAKTRPHLSKAEKKGVRRLMGEYAKGETDENYIKMFWDREVFPMVDGSYTSAKELNKYAEGPGEGNLRSGDNTNITQELIDRGVPVLDKDRVSFSDEKIFTELPGIEGGLWYEPEPIKETPEYEELAKQDYEQFENLTRGEKLVAEALERLQSIAGMGEKMRDVKWGDGPAGVKGWTDGENWITLDREHFDEWTEDADESPSDLIQAVEHVFPTFVHELTHDEDTRGTMESHRKLEWFKEFKKKYDILSDAKRKFFDQHRVDSGWSFEDLKRSVNIEMLKYLPSSKTKSKQLLEEEVT